GQPAAALGKLRAAEPRTALAAAEIHRRTALGALQVRQQRRRRRILDRLLAVEVDDVLDLRVVDRSEKLPKTPGAKDHLRVVLVTRDVHTLRQQRTALTLDASSVIAIRTRSAGKEEAVLAKPVARRRTALGTLVNGRLGFG